MITSNSSLKKVNFDKYEYKISHGLFQTKKINELAKMENSILYFSYGRHNIITLDIGTSTSSYFREYLSEIYYNTVVLCFTYFLQTKVMLVSYEDLKVH